MRLHVALELRPTCFTPFSFYAPCQCIQLLNLCPLIFGVLAVGLLLSVTLTLVYSIVSYGSIVSDLHVITYVHFLGKQLGCKTMATCTVFLILLDSHVKQIV